MTNPDIRIEVLRGRRGCLIWFLVLLTTMTVATSYFYRNELDLNRRLQLVIETVVAFGNDLIGVEPTPPPAPDYEAVVTNYRNAEAALLNNTLNDATYNDVTAALPQFVTGDALTKLLAAGENLRNSSRFQKITWEELTIVQPLLELSTAKLLTTERRRVETHERRAGGEVLVETVEEDIQGVYQFVHNGRSWLVERVVLTPRP